MDELTEEVLAVDAAQDAAVTVLFRGILAMVGIESGSDERKAIIRKWIDEGCHMLDRASFPNLPPESEGRIKENAKRNLAHMLTMAEH